MQSEPDRVKMLQQRSEEFLTLAKQSGLNVGEGKNSAVIPIITGASNKALKLSQHLFAKCINVQPILYPAVEESGARLRFFITSDHTAEEIQFTVKTISERLIDLDREVKCPGQQL